MTATAATDAAAVDAHLMVVERGAFALDDLLRAARNGPDALLVYDAEFGFLTWAPDHDAKVDAAPRAIANRRQSPRKLSLSRLRTIAERAARKFGDLGDDVTFLTVTMMIANVDAGRRPEAARDDACLRDALRLDRDASWPDLVDSGAVRVLFVLPVIVPSTLDVATMRALSIVAQGKDADEALSFSVSRASCGDAPSRLIVEPYDPEGVCDGNAPPLPDPMDLSCGAPPPLPSDAGIAPARFGFRPRSRRADGSTTPTPWRSTSSRKVGRAGPWRSSTRRASRRRGTARVFGRGICGASGDSWRRRIS